MKERRWGLVILGGLFSFVGFGFGIPLTNYAIANGISSLTELLVLIFFDFLAVACVIWIIMGLTTREHTGD